MKKTALVFIMALGLSMMFSSCKDDCCDCYGSEICRDDYATQALYNAATTGCDC